MSKKKYPETYDTLMKVVDEACLRLQSQADFIKQRQNTRKSRAGEYYFLTGIIRFLDKREFFRDDDKTDDPHYGK